MLSEKFDTEMNSYGNRYCFFGKKNHAHDMESNKIHFRTSIVNCRDKFKMENKCENKCTLQHTNNNSAHVCIRLSE